MPVLKPYRFAFERFAIALIGTLIFADLSPTLPYLQKSFSHPYQKFRPPTPPKQTWLLPLLSENSSYRISLKRYPIRISHEKYSLLAIWYP